MDAFTGERYRISYHQTIRILTEAEYHKLKRKIEMKKKEEKRLKDAEQSIKAKIGAKKAKRDKLGRFARKENNTEDKPQNDPA